VTTAGGADVVFSFICNAYTTSPDAVLRIMDTTAALLADLPETP
jgi:hypothetical protein